MSAKKLILIVAVAATTATGVYAKQRHDYTDALPSVALKFATSDSANIRLVYSRALSRPDPSDITQAVGIPNTTQNPPTVSLGNPDLKPEHANNYDIVFEQYFKPLGMLQAGYFYKSLSDPIIAQARIAVVDP